MTQQRQPPIKQKFIQSQNPLIVRYNQILSNDIFFLKIFHNVIKLKSKILKSMMSSLTLQDLLRKRNI